MEACTNPLEELRKVSKVPKWQDQLSFCVGFKDSKCFNKHFWSFAGDRVPNLLKTQHTITSTTGC